LDVTKFSVFDRRGRHSSVGRARLFSRTFTTSPLRRGGQNLRSSALEWPTWRVSRARDDSGHAFQEWWLFRGRGSRDFSCRCTLSCGACGGPSGYIASVPRGGAEGLRLDTSPRELLRQDTCENVDVCLACGVGRALRTIHYGRAAEGEQRRQVNHRSGLARDHARDGGAGQPHKRRQMNVDAGSPSRSARDRRP
jgi:hypothetical protein